MSIHFSFFTLYFSLLIFSAYLIGSVPTAVWIGKIFFGIDVRDHGSGNAGVTNAIRILGIEAGIPVLIIDVFKGWIAIHITSLLHYEFTQEYLFINFQLMMGTAALIGHIFPVFAKFKGGKGIATLSGIAIAVFPWAILISVGVFIIVFLIWHYVSLGSIIASIIFPIAVIFIFNTQMQSLIIFSILIALFVPLTHRKNIIRLFNGEESKLSFRKKKKTEM